MQDYGVVSTSDDSADPRAPHFSFVRSPFNFDVLPTQFRILESLEATSPLVVTVSHLTMPIPREDSFTCIGTPPDDPSDDESSELGHVTPSEVIHRIECLTHRILEMLQRDESPVLEPYDMPGTGNTSNQRRSVHSAAVTTKTYEFSRWNQCRPFTSISLILSYCHSLLLAERTTTTREVYYYYVTHFRSQRECDAAIWNVCELLRVDRHDLGLVASPRGWFCGDIQLVSAHEDEILMDGRTLLATQGAPIASEWLTVFRHETFRVQTHRAQCILVIEKEGIYKRLSEDRFFDRFPCILVTGKGFPDLATRAMVEYTHQQTGLPVRGLADCNPFGVMVLNSYQKKENTPRGSFGVPHVEWVGLRPSQVAALRSLPKPVFQQLTDLDRKRLDHHLLSDTHGWSSTAGKCVSDQIQRRTELEGMRQFKVELEALHWLGIDYCGTWLAEILEFAAIKHRNEQGTERTVVPDHMQII